MRRTIIITVICISIEHICRILFGNPKHYYYNYGMAFSTFQDMPIISSIVTALACVLIAYGAFYPYIGKWEKAGYSIMLGGGLSNLAEKLILGYVIDWIPIPFIPMVINIADIEISIGSLISFYTSCNRNS